MRIAKALTDLPVGTPIQISFPKKRFWRDHKGLVIKSGQTWNGYDFIKILFADGTIMIYYEEDLKDEGIKIVEVLK